MNRSDFICKNNIHFLVKNSRKKEERRGEEGRRSQRKQEKEQK
jgi:hypothetical protein